MPRPVNPPGLNSPSDSASPRALCSALGSLWRKSFSVTSLLFYVITSLFPAACSHPSTPKSSTITFLLESSPTNLDPRYATDAQSQHIDGLLFSSLLQRDAQMKLQGDLAESWDTPDP